jgi:hypothetical protein
MKAREARMASPTVKHVEAALHLVNSAALM